MFIKIGLSTEEKDYIKGFLNSPAYIDVPGLSDIQADYVPEKGDFQAMLAWAASRSGDPLANFIQSSIKPACLMAVRRNAESGGDQNNKVIRMQDTDNVHEIAAIMEGAMSSTGIMPMLQGMQPQIEQTSIIPQPQTVPQEEVGQMILPTIPTPSSTGQGVFNNPLIDAPIDILSGLDNYIKGIEKIITAEVRRRVKEVEKVHKLEIKEKDATIARINAELNRIKAAINGTKI